MSKNFIPEIAKMLGVEVGEEFKIAYSDGPDPKGTYQLTDQSLLHIDGDSTVWAEEWLVELLNGSAEIVKKPWKPKNCDEYYWVDSAGNVRKSLWGHIDGLLFMYRLGNCYRTFKEAKVNVDKWMNFYADDSPIDWEEKR